MLSINICRINWILVVIISSLFNFSALGRSINAPFISSFNHYTEQDLIYQPQRLLRTKHLDDWYIAISNTTDILIDGAGRMRHSITYKIGKNKKPSQVVTNILQDDCYFLQNGTVITVAGRSISTSKNKNEYDEAKVVINLDYESLQHSDLYTYLENRRGKLSYCVQTELYFEDENSIKQTSVSFIRTRFSFTVDLSPFSNEF